MELNCDVNIKYIYIPRIPMRNTKDWNTVPEYLNRSSYISAVEQLPVMFHSTLLRFRSGSQRNPSSGVFSKVDDMSKFESADSGVGDVSHSVPFILIREFLYFSPLSSIIFVFSSETRGYI